MTVLTRRALYDLVWSKPVRTVADELNISDVGLRKVCVRADIPIPARGYWAKREAGKPVVQTALPPRPPGASDIAYGSTGRGYRWPPDPEAELAEPEPVEPVFEEPFEEVEARVRKAIGTVRYMRSLGDAHPQVKRVLQKDEDRARTYSWQTAKFDSPFEQRRFKLLSSLFFGVVRCGGKASLSGEAARSCHISVGGQGVSFSLDHPKAKTDRWGGEHVHGGKTDVLKLQIQHMEDEPDRKCVWLDTDQESIEDQLTDITVALILAGEIRYRPVQCTAIAMRLSAARKCGSNSRDNAPRPSARNGNVLPSWKRRDANACLAMPATGAMRMTSAHSSRWFRRACETSIPRRRWIPGLRGRTLSPIAWTP